MVVRKDRRTGLVTPASRAENVGRAYRESKRKGVGSYEELRTTSWGKIAVLKDPDGNLSEIS